MTRNEAEDVFIGRFRGLVAHMLSITDAEVSKEVMQFVNGKDDLSIRQVGMIAYDLGFHIEIGFRSAEGSHQ